jgi:hypothetical protein
MNELKGEDVILGNDFMTAYEPYRKKKKEYLNVRPMKNTIPKYISLTNKSYAPFVSA